MTMWVSGCPRLFEPRGGLVIRLVPIAGGSAEQLAEAVDLLGRGREAGDEAVDCLVVAEMAVEA